MWKFIRYSAFSILILASLSGCGKLKQNIPVVTTEISPISTVATQAVIPSDSSATEPETAPATVPEEATMRHIVQEIDENIRVDAELTVPSKEAYSTYTLKMVDSDPDRLFGIFCPEGYGSYTHSDRGYHRYFEENGKKLVVREDSISYSAYNIELGENPMQDVGALMSYYTKEHPQTDPHDLSFMAATEMEPFCKNIFNQLGIAFEPKLERCVTLTGQEIMDFQNELFGENRSEREMMPTPTTLTTATDTCYLEFSFTYDGLPLLGSEEPGVSSAVNMMPTPSVTATIMINADGIQDCDVYFPCTIESESQPQTILTPDEAVAALKDKYGLEIHTSTIEFSNAWLEYIPVVSEDSVTLTPYWCFVTPNEWAEDSDGASGWYSRYSDAQRFNAFTGKDLTYGG